MERDCRSLGLPIVVHREVLRNRVRERDLPCKLRIKIPLGAASIALSFGRVTGSVDPVVLPHAVHHRLGAVIVINRVVAVIAAPDRVEDCIAVGENIVVEEQGVFHRCVVGCAPADKRETILCRRLGQRHRVLIQTAHKRRLAAVGERTAVAVERHIDRRLVITGKDDTVFAEREAGPVDLGLQGIVRAPALEDVTRLGGHLRIGRRKAFARAADNLIDRRTAHGVETQRPAAQRPAGIHIHGNTDRIALALQIAAEIITRGIHRHRPSDRLRHLRIVEPAGKAVVLTRGNIGRRIRSAEQ